MAEAALVLWVPLTFLLFARLHAATAATLGILAGLLLLPVRAGFDVVGLPELDKYRISVVAAFSACVFLRPHALRPPRMGLLLSSFCVVLLGSGFLTALTNSDPIHHGAVSLKGLRPWDGISMAASSMLDLVLPFYLGWTLYRQPRDLGRLLNVFTVAICAYSLLVLVELRLSPQLHKWVYGYRHFFWANVFREGGVRPIVFMHSGLALSVLIATACFAPAAASRARERVVIGIGRGLRGTLRLPAGPVAVYLLGILIACKSFAAITYGAAGSGVIAFLRSRSALRIGASLSLIVLLYPTLRYIDIFPTDEMVDAAAVVNEERAQSLAYRFHMEDILLERAIERPWLGWGGWSRNRVYDERSGRDISITDGYWVIVLGIRGALGFVSTFGLILTPVFLAAGRFGRLRSQRDRWLVTGTAWIVVVRAIDLLPNGFLNPFTMFVAGALAGVCTRMGRGSADPRTRPARTPTLRGSQGAGEAAARTC